MPRSMTMALLSLLLPMGCVDTPAMQGAVQSGSTVASATLTQAPAPVLDTPSNVPGRLVVKTPKPALTLRVDAQRVALVQEGKTRDLIVDKNDLIFAGRHVMAHDNAGAVEVLVAGQICQDPESGGWNPYSARVTLDDGEFIFGCAQDAPAQ